MPSTNNEIIGGLTFIACKVAVAPMLTNSINNSKYPFSQSPTVNVKKNTQAITAKKIGILATLCVKNWSILSVKAALSSL